MNNNKGLRYPHICEKTSDIPKEAYIDLDSYIVEGLGKSFSDLYPQFSAAFPKAVAVLDNQWNKPKLALKKMIRTWISYIVVQSEKSNLFFPLQPNFIDKEGELFDEPHEMLPYSWVELYRWFNSFCLTDDGHALGDYWNTPFRYESRLDLDDFKQGSGASTNEINKLAHAFDCPKEYIRCWLLTENKDALFINEQSKDRKVFHINGTNFEKITELNNPASKLDDYLSHFVSGNNPKKFNWVD